MSWNTYTERRLNLNDKYTVEQIRNFLADFELSFDSSMDYTVGIFDDNERLVATGSRSGSILRNIAVDENLQGEGLTAQLIGHLIKQASECGVYHYFIFTQPRKSVMFEGLGFKQIASAPPYAAILESGNYSIEKWVEQIAQQADAKLPANTPRAAIVVNCNPFTLGHKALIKHAASNMPTIVFVVEEDLSFFPFSVRFNLVQQGLADLPNVLVVPGGKYIISSATFPSYFTKREDLASAQTKLDAMIFATKIAPKLGVVKRYLGEEPLSPVTEIYNQSLNAVLPLNGMQVEIIPRVEAAGDVISASRVRQLLAEDRIEELKDLLPPTTYQFLQSEAALPIITNIKKSIC